MAADSMPTSGKWPKIFGQGLALIVLPSLVLVGLEIYQITRNVPELRRSQNLVDHTIEVITVTHALERAIRDAERGQRGFLITGDPAYLEPYRKGLQEIPGSLAKLKQLTADNPEQQHRWPALEQQINVKLDELKRTIDTRQNQGFDAAREIVETNVGTASMHTISEVIDAATAAEYRLLKERQALGDDAERTTAIVSLIGGGVALLGIILGSILVTGSFRRILRTEHDLRESEAALRRETGERERAEGILRQAQKMAVLGQLTGGIAHDFNNMLGVIIGNLEILQRRLPSDNQRVQNPIQAALQGAERSAVLTHRLLAFSRRQTLEPRTIDVNRLVSGMSGLLNRTLGESIAIETVLAAGLWTVSADVNQLENALLNLAVNARDAMPNGGKLTIETANTHLDEAYASAQVEVTPGQYVMLAVTDTGIGMSQETIEKAFEPFFTLKETGQGTGLGLSQVYGFIKQSNGHVKIYSELGEGTTVKVYLPRSAGDSVVSGEAITSPPVAAQPRSQSILVVEDNELLLASVATMLREQGYRVLTAPNGSIALAVLASNNVNLLFTDVRLPGQLDGRQLADQGRRLYPDLKVLFTTGYTQNAVIHQGRLDPGVEMIGKPFTYAALALKIQRVLGETG